MGAAAGRRTRRTALASVLVLGAVYAPFALALVLDEHLAGDSDCRQAWVRRLVFLPGLLPAALIDAAAPRWLSIADHDLQRQLLACLVIAAWVALGTWLASRGTTWMLHTAWVSLTLAAGLAWAAAQAFRA